MCHLELALLLVTVEVLWDYFYLPNCGRFLMDHHLMQTTAYPQPTVEYSMSQDFDICVVFYVTISFLIRSLKSILIIEYL